VLQRRLKRTPADAVALSVVTEMEIRYGLERNPRLRIAPRATLVTNNLEEFRRVPGLKAVDWTR